MKKCTILFSTVHPSPYMDEMIECIKCDYKVNVIYNYLSDKYKKWNNYSWVAGFLFKDLSLKRIIELIRVSNFIIIGGWGSWECIKLILLSKLLSKKIAVFSDCPIKVKKNLFTYWFKKYFLFKQINYFFCATISTIDIYSKYYNIDLNRLKYFPYAFNVPKESYIENINNSRIQELKNGSLPRIFISNSFYKRKGYDILFELFKEVEKNNLLEKYDISIAGLGEGYTNYKFKFKSLSSKIKFLGWLEYEDYLDMMNNTDIFIHTSLFEPFGIPPIDAMARGKLLIVSDGVQSTTLIIKNGQNGYIYSATDAKQLITIFENIKIESIYDIGLNAIKTTSENYSKEVYSKVLKECLDQISNKH